MKTSKQFRDAYRCHLLVDRYYRSTLFLNRCDTSLAAKKAYLAMANAGMFTRNTVTDALVDNAMSVNANDADHLRLDEFLSGKLLDHREVNGIDVHSFYECQPLEL